MCSTCILWCCCVYILSKWCCASLDAAANVAAEQPRGNFYTFFSWTERCVFLLTVAVCVMLFPCMLLSAHPSRRRSRVRKRRVTTHDSWPLYSLPSNNLYLYVPYTLLCGSIHHVQLNNSMSTFGAIVKNTIISNSTKQQLITQKYSIVIREQIVEHHRRPRKYSVRKKQLSERYTSTSVKK